MVGLDDARRGRQLGQLDQPLAEPLLVGVLGGDAVLELVVGDDALLGRVDQEHAARLKAALGHDLIGRDVQHAGLGRHHDAAVGGDVVAGRAQAVAVERGPDADAVGERDRGGPVPRLHQAGVELVEGLLLGRHRLVMLPGLRHHHHQAVRRGSGPRGRAARGRCRGWPSPSLRCRSTGRALVSSSPNSLELNMRLAGVHPVDVAAQGVDLAVVGDVAVRVRARPRREGVGEKREWTMAMALSTRSSRRSG